MNIFNTLLREKERKKYRSKSMHKIRNPKFEKEFKLISDEKELSLFEKINKYLLQYKEIKRLYKLTHIPPVFFITVLAIILLIILAILFFKNLTLSLSTLYPLFMTFKTLQKYDSRDEQTKKDVFHWLKYWTFYGLILNFESCFSFILKDFYNFFKIITVLNCFPGESFLLEWIFSIIYNFFNNYESNIIDSVRTINEHMMGENNENKENNEEGNNSRNILGNYINSGINTGAKVFNVVKNLY